MLSKEQIISLLADKQNQNNLFAKADLIRKNYLGDEIHLRALIEFSNICRNNCLYCGIRHANKCVIRYRLTEEEIIQTTKNAVNLGFKTIVLQSGEDIYFTQDRMCHIIEAIKKYDVALTLSIGERSYKEYQAFRNAGANRYLMRIETTDKDLYHKLDPNMSWQQRYECLLMIKELGYELGSGIMVGLPNQTIESIANDLLFLKELGIDMAGIGPFIPHKETPLAHQQGGSLDLSLRTIAVMRLLMPDINIPATTAMETLAKDGRIKALQAGANVIMPNMTDINHRKLYELYPNKAGANETSLTSYENIIKKITKLGRVIGKGYGNHKQKS